MDDIVIRLWTSRLVKFVFLPGLVCCLLAFIAADQWSRYRFGASLYQMAGRYLPKEIAWQKEQRPSLTPFLSILEKIIPPDDRYNFGLINNELPSIWPKDWVTELVGPSTSYYSSSVKYDPTGRPDPVLQKNMRKQIRIFSQRKVLVNTAPAFLEALKNAKKGDTITLAPGNYLFKGHAISLLSAGDVNAPIRVRAARLGDAHLQFNLLEGFHVRAPYWIFENLEIEGVCKKHSRCEHAFHIVGKGKNITLRNLFIKNFNSHIKVNGSRSGHYPDGGLIEYSMFINDGPRKTGNPVSLIDIVAANSWIVRKSVIADFAKAKGDKVSYAGFFKGAGQNNLFEQNLILCNFRHRGGVRVGLSFGGGGTSTNASRNNINNVEHFGGILRQNVIANCPLDVGVYLNKSMDTLITRNLLINNTGIHVRFDKSDALILGNSLSGSIVDRDGGQHEPINNSNKPSFDKFSFPHSFQDESVRSILQGDLASDRVAKRYEAFSLSK